MVIADDHALVRSGLKDVLLRLGGAAGSTGGSDAGQRGVEVVGEATNGIEAISLGKTLRPDLMLLDAGMPLARGMEVFGEVRRWSPDTRIAVVTGFTAAHVLADWIAAGVDGLFLKTCSGEEMAHGFALVLRGEGYIAREVLEVLERAEAQEVEALTLRERQVLHLIAEGCSNAAIAERLSISVKTVDNHRTRMMAKLKVHSVAQLLSYALKAGLLDADQQL